LPKTPQIIFAEYREALSCPELKIRKGLRRQLMDLILGQSHPVSPSRHLHVTQDPDDNLFPECATIRRPEISGTFQRFGSKPK
jgi:hypothetical protein